MPDPRQPDFTSRAADEVIAILERTEGRAFVLFTSYASMHAVRERVARALPYPMLTQGTAPRGVLLETFRRTPNAVLFATSSFWQGVDVVGDALSCVIIDKLPFASPGDPIVAARLEAIAARGGDPFADPAGSARHPDAAAGPRPPAPSPRRSRHPGDPRSAAADDGLRPALHGLAAARAHHADRGRHFQVHGGDRPHLISGRVGRGGAARGRRRARPAASSTASTSSSGMKGLARKAEPSGSR